MQRTFDLDFCYKGSRTYVHGTDIFTKIMEHYTTNVKKLDLTFHGITTNNMTFLTEKPEGQEIKVTFKCLHSNETIRLFGVENSTKVDCRYEYFEEKIVKNSTVAISSESIVLNAPTEYAFIEHIVAMNKALVENLYSDVAGKWYFTRLQLTDNVTMQGISSLQLVLRSNFQFKLTKSAILVDDKEVGFVYFSLIPKES